MQLSIERFKCYSSFDVECSAITVLCGKNGAGKSTVIQALLLHRLATDALANNLASPTRIALNGPYSMALGAASDLRPMHGEGQGSSEAVITVDDHRIRLWPDQANDIEDFLFAEFVDKTSKQPIQPDQSDIPHFVYLSAERVGPRLVQERLQGYRLADVGIGACGENSAEFLKFVQRRKVDDAIGAYSGIEADWVLKHLEFWLSRLFGEIFVRVEDNGRFSAPSLQFREANTRANWLYPTHHGFGISYALPILLAGLASCNGDTIVVDSPEAHLHPAAQTEIAAFLFMLATAGRQIVVETHSDHIVDGLRLAFVNRQQPEFTSENCKILFFSKDTNGPPNIEEIFVRPDGSLSHWPAGFFDQMSLNLRSISDAKKARRE